MSLLREATATYMPAEPHPYAPGPRLSPEEAEAFNELVSLAQNSDMEALGTVWATYADIPRTIATTFGNLHTQEEIIQLTSEKVIRNIGQFQVGTNFAAWLTTVSLHAGIDYCRGLTRQHPTDPTQRVEKNIPVDHLDHEALFEASADRTDSGIPTPEAMCDQTLSAERVAGVLSRLPPEQREALVEVGLHGLRHDEYADKAGIELRTVRTRYYGARAALKKMIENGEIQVNHIEGTITAA